MGMTPIQRYRIRQYLKRIQLQREYKKQLMTSQRRRQKIFSWIKPIAKVGFWIFLFKGLLWLLLIYFGVGIL